MNQTPPPADRRWLSQNEAGAYLGVSDRTIREYIARGTLPAKRIEGSNRIRIRRDHLDAMLTDIPNAS